MTRQLPDIAALNARLGAQNHRVQDYLDGLAGRLDRLVDAALAHDWEAVQHWSREISQSGEAGGAADVLTSAQHVLDAAGRTGSEAELKRRVMKLIAACSRARQ